MNKEARPPGGHEAGDALERGTDAAAAALPALRKERAFLQAVLENARDGIVACDADGVLTLFNRATRAFHGLPEAPIPAGEWAEHYDLYNPDGTPMRTEDIPLFRALQGENVEDVEMVIAPKRGKRRTLLASGQALRDAAGNKLGAVVVMHDITARKEAEEERARRVTLEASGRLLSDLRYVLTHARCLLWHGTVTDSGHGPGAYHWETEVFDEAAAQEFFPLELAPGERYTDGWYRHRLPEGRALNDRVSAEALQANRPVYGVEFGCRGRGGAAGWFDERVYVEPLPAPAPPGTLAHWRVVGVAIDVTERRRSQEALRAAHAQTVEILESVQDGFYAVDAAWRFTYVNRRAEEMWGIGREALLGRNLWEAFPGSVGGRIQEELLRAAERRSAAEFDLFSPVMGRWLSVTVNPTGAGLSVYFRDITERRRAREERRAFLRDVLAGVTDGKLRLCELAADLPERLPGVGEPVPLTRETLRPARRRAADAALAAGLDEERGHDLLTAVGEATMNAVVHGGGGTAHVGADAQAGRVQVWVEDHGAGIDVSRLPQATLARGYTTAGTFGHGFKMMLQTADAVWLLTGPTGTTVVLEQGREAPEPGWLAGF